MKTITAYPLYEHTPVLRAGEAVGAGLPRDGVHGRGFDLLCPHAFEAVWHGGPGAEDLEIRHAAGASAQDFVQSCRGEGLLTFYPGYQFKTAGEQALWVRGPVNASKDGITPLEIMIDTSVLPCGFTMHWKLTRPGQIIRFEAGEPFCTVLPCPKDGPARVEPEVVRLDSEDAFAQETEQMIEDPGVERVFQRLFAAGGGAAPPGPRSTTLDAIPYPPPFQDIPSPRALPAEKADQLFRGDYPARISVILPALNESVLLQRTVEQFEATLPPGSEIIVVDNGSTDGSTHFLAAETRENVRLIRTSEPLGVAGARNCGLAEARGEIVVFADAHIDVPSNWWQPMVDLLNRPAVGVIGPGIGVMGALDHTKGYGQRIARSELRLDWLLTKTEEAHPVPSLGGGFMAMRHDTLKRAGAFDEGMWQWGTEDAELCVRYWLLGYEVWVVPEVTVLHYYRKQRPYRVETHCVTHNMLRFALLHFNQERTARVMTALKDKAGFGRSLATVLGSDIWQKRADFAARRVRDDDWLFERFSDCCHV